jgi:hypothetical protein
MPNWCYNTVRISGHGNYKVEKLMEAVKGKKVEQDGKEYQSPFSFNSIVPMPEDIRDTTSPTRISETNTQEQVDALQEKYDVTNWYDWAIKNWGTKWDLNAFHDDTQVDYHEDANEVTYRFDTAWSPPQLVHEALVEQYPAVNISWHYDEPDMEFSGYL